jgi:hypothetical protein
LPRLIASSILALRHRKLDCVLAVSDRLPGNSIMRIGQNPTKMVIFFGIEGPNGIEYGGTGFLVTDLEQGTEIPILVTCRHLSFSVTCSMMPAVRARVLSACR